MIQAQTLKGFRDFLPQQAAQRQKLMKAIQTVFERFGFDPLETPALEYATTLLGKYGDEADKLLYLFDDNGGRKVGLRYDQTVPTARVVAQYPDIPKPFKRYQIQPVWRAENTQKGRYREFLQCDADIIGVDSPLADAELLVLAAACLDAIGLSDYTIYINDRSIFADIPNPAIITIDKLDKIGEEGVKKELSDRGFDPELLTKLINTPQTERLTHIYEALNALHFPQEKVAYSPTLARGLDYYTGMIMEIKLASYTAGSVCGGGRYNNLIEQFIGQSVPAAGFAFGFDRLIDALNERNNNTVQLTATQVLVTVFQPDLLTNSLAITTELRAAGISTEVFLDPTQKLEKQLKYADRKGIPYVVIQGPDEVNENAIMLKDMKAKEQWSLPIEKVIQKLTNDN